ncbi:MAG: Glu-tRNA(Gln) amidotransferase subunit GatD [Candidatus Odinarchaeota archaeon]|nr:Glu-tRNA(Gln) amidotransferase subunit GatD [Candidatus Odinarchaeota archaeon]
MVKGDAEKSNNYETGYYGRAEKLLKKFNISVGDKIRVSKKDKTTYEGYLLPRGEIGRDDSFILIKLKNGYNLGINIENINNVEKIGEAVEIKPSPPEVPLKVSEELPRVMILTTGGTIASRVDYHSGAVFPALDARDLYNIVPELGDIVRIDAELLFSVFSENIFPKHWTAIAKKVAEVIDKGYDGVVITHGTDTMGYTAAALSFALQSLPVPVVLVGAQRSSDRPSSDAALNLKSAVRIAGYAPFSAVTVVMHEETSDKYCVAHPGTKVRKCHTSRRDAFKTINDTPIARTDGQEIIMLKKNFVPRDKNRKLKLEPNFEDKVALLKIHPGFNTKIIDFLVDSGYRGIVIEGTGLGHAPSSIYESIKRGTDSGVTFVMTSQCIWGRIHMNVYRTGRELLSLGVIPGEDMLPETALVKLMWVLAKEKTPEKVKELMLTNIVGELTPRTQYNEYNI